MLTVEGLTCRYGKVTAVSDLSLEVHKGELVTLIEVPNAPEPEPSIWDLWPDEAVTEPTIRKMDHLAFNVDTIAELAWFHDHLEASGVKVTKILGRATFVRSIYFTDPTGNPLEIATFDWSDPVWATHDRAEWLMDDNPVVSLRSGK